MLLGQMVHGSNKIVSLYESRIARGVVRAMERARAGRVPHAWPAGGLPALLEEGVFWGGRMELYKFSGNNMEVAQIQ